MDLSETMKPFSERRRAPNGKAIRYPEIRVHLKKDYRKSSLSQKRLRANQFNECILAWALHKRATYSNELLTKSGWNNRQI